MKRSRTALVVGLVLTLIGVWLTGSLMMVHVEGTSGSGLLGKVCGGVGSGCDKVIASRWSVFPPARAAESEPSGEESGAGEEPAAKPATNGADQAKGGIPVAALGLFYFSIIAVWLAAMRGLAWEREWMHRGLLVLCVLGCLGSIFYIIIMAVAVRAFCPLCLGSHVANFALLGTVVFLRPRAVVAAAVPEPAKKTKKGQPKKSPAKPERSELRPRPTLERPLAVVTVVLAATVCYAEWKTFRSIGVERTNAELTALLEQYGNDARALELVYFQLPTLEIEIREDDPTIEASSGTRMTMIYFTDLECPYCAAFEEFLNEQVKPMFNGHLRVIFKHFPITAEHPNAMRAAQAAEAARLQGKFWEMHDRLIELRLRLRSVDYVKLAEELGLDAERFAQDMESDAVKQRIREDMAAGNRIGIPSTPTVVLQNRKLDPYMRELPGFWQLRAEGLRRIRAGRNQPW